MTIGIYGIFASRTNECLYVGQSKSIEDRWKNHLKDLRSNQHKRKGFIEWFGDHDKKIESLRFEILEECENVALVKNQLERKWFEKLNPKFYGKHPSDNESWDLTIETRMKIAESVRRSRGNKSGSTIKDLMKRCSECRNPTKMNCGICRKCQKEIKVREIDTVWKDRIISWYVSEGISCREIARRISVEDRIDIPFYLRRYGVEVTPRTFNGRKFSDDSRKRRSKILKSRSSSKGFYIMCKSCGEKVRTRPSRLRKFCSRLCYKDYGQVLQSSSNV